jgi:hypothetical protein
VVYYRIALHLNDALLVWIKGGILRVSQFVDQPVLFVDELDGILQMVVELSLSHPQLYLLTLYIDKVLASIIFSEISQRLGHFLLHLPSNQRYLCLRI